MGRFSRIHAPLQIPFFGSFIPRFPQFVAFRLSGLLRLINLAPCFMATIKERKPIMNATARDNWNPQLNIDTVAFSSVLATGLLVIWFAAATSAAAFDAAPAMTHYDFRAANAARDSHIVVTAPHFKTGAGAQAACAEKTQAS
jgi:hypothetical protein